MDFNSSRGVLAAGAAGVLQPERPERTVAAPALTAEVRIKFLLVMDMGILVRSGKTKALGKLGKCELYGWY